MMKKINSRLSTAVLATALALSSLSLAGCAETAPTAGTNANTGATNAAQQPAATNAPLATNRAPGQMQAPLGMEDSIVGKVVGLACYRKNPGNIDATIACTKQNIGQNEALVVLGNDNVVYAGEGDARIVSGQLQPFVGQEVTVQGKMGADAPDMSWENVTVKKFKYGIVRRNGPPPADAPRINPQGKMGPGGQITPAQPQQKQ
jgi:hypothetical protein